MRPRDTQVGQDLLASRQDFERIRAGLEKDYLHDVSDVERQLLTATGDDRRRLRSQRVSLIDDYVAEVDELATRQASQERGILDAAYAQAGADMAANRQGIADLSRQIKAQGPGQEDPAAVQQRDGLLADQNRLAKQRGLYSNERQALDSVYPGKDQVRRALLDNLLDQRSRAYERDEAQLPRQVSADEAAGRAGRS